MASSVVLISGCSSGFGLLSAVHLAVLGHRVFATLRNLDKQENLQAALAEKQVSADILQLDVTDDHSIQGAVAHLQEQVGYLDVLINNAGFALGGAFEDVSEAQIRTQMETNFFGVLKLTRACLPLLRKSAAGKIINISSFAGVSGIPGISLYSASKFALEGFSEALSYELASFGISVSLIEPGSYPTLVQSNRLMAENFDNPESPYYEQSQTMLKANDQRVGRRQSDPQEVINVIAEVVHTAKPRLRYLVGRDAKVGAFLRRMLPFRLYSRILRRALLR
ncbi:MAG: SDR family NAD(P)-dependent oxidoreductase [Cyanobacteriota bacterium]|nr:SDR family NAD(P)-dependent oxidoreductase [Cyanobacteriota bacterium]